MEQSSPPLRRFQRKKTSSDRRPSLYFFRAPSLSSPSLLLFAFPLPSPWSRRCRVFLPRICLYSSILPGFVLLRARRRIFILPGDVCARFFAPLEPRSISLALQTTVYIYIYIYMYVCTSKRLLRAESCAPVPPEDISNKRGSISIRRRVNRRIWPAASATAPATFAPFLYVRPCTVYKYIHISGRGRLPRAVATSRGKSVPHGCSTTSSAIFSFLLWQLPLDCFPQWRNERASYCRRDWNFSCNFNRVLLSSKRAFT